MVLRIASDYSLVTGLRYCIFSEKSGEDFYHKKLNSAFAECIRNKDKLQLVLDGVVGGFTPSFLDEAVGNLVYDFGLKTVKSKLEITSDREQQWIVLLKEKTYPNWEKRRLEKREPKITEDHPAWYRLDVNGNLVCKVWCNVDNKDKQNHGNV